MWLNLRCCRVFACRWSFIAGCVLLVMFVLLGAFALHYWHHPEALPYGWLQQLQQSSQQGWVHDTCSTGSGKLPVLQQQVCRWVQRAVRVLPDQHYMQAMHDEL